MLKHIRIDGMIRWLVLLGVIIICGCEELGIQDTASLLVPRFQRSEILGLVAGFGTTFAAVPDLVRMFRRQSSKGINPTMAGIWRGFSGCLGLLWSFDCVTAGDFVELYRRDNKFHDRLGIFSICSP